MNKMPKTLGAFTVALLLSQAAHISAAPGLGALTTQLGTLTAQDKRTLALGAAGATAAYLTLAALSSLWNRGTRANIGYLQAEIASTQATVGAAHVKEMGDIYNTMSDITKQRGIDIKNPQARKALAEFLLNGSGVGSTPKATAIGTPAK